MCFVSIQCSSDVHFVGTGPCFEIQVDFVSFLLFVLGFVGFAGFSSVFSCVGMYFAEFDWTEVRFCEVWSGSGRFCWTCFLWRETVLVQF